MCFNGLTGFQKLKMFSVSTASMWFTGSVKAPVVASQLVAGGVSQLFMTTEPRVERKSHPESESSMKHAVRNGTGSYQTFHLWVQDFPFVCFDWKAPQDLQAKQKKLNSSDLPIRMIRNEQSQDVLEVEELGWTRTPSARPGDVAVLRGT